eukprot:g24959.t1
MTRRCLSTAAAENIVAAGGRVEILEGVAPGFLASDEMGDEELGLCRVMLSFVRMILGSCREVSQGFSRHS